MRALQRLPGKIPLLLSDNRLSGNDRIRHQHPPLPWLQPEVQWQPLPVTQLVPRLSVPTQAAASSNEPNSKRLLLLRLSPPPPQSLLLATPVLAPQSFSIKV